MYRIYAWDILIVLGFCVSGLVLKISLNKINFYRLIRFICVLVLVALVLLSCGALCVDSLPLCAVVRGFSIALVFHLAVIYLSYQTKRKGFPLRSFTTEPTR